MTFDPFIISLATNLTTSAGKKLLISLFNNDNFVEETETAYHEALKEWAPKNKHLRRSLDSSFGYYLRKINEENLSEITFSDDDKFIRTFLLIFKEKLSKKPTYAAYINTSQNRLILKNLNQIKPQIDLFEPYFKNILESIKDLNPHDKRAKLLEDKVLLSNVIKKLNNYIVLKIQHFEDERPPYGIDMDLFVELFDYSTGSLKKRHSMFSENCIESIIRNLETKAMFCIAYYGMGKTTIAKYIFSKIREPIIPIFIQLSRKPLNHFVDPIHSENSNYLANIVTNEVRSLIEMDDIQTETLRFYIELLLKKRQILLIFDGLDEAANNDADNIYILLEYLKKVNYCFLITCRLEFSPLFGITNPFLDQEHIAFELHEWTKIQWEKYVNALAAVFQDKTDQIDIFKKELDLRSFGDIPERPLFLKMLSDLFILGENYSEVNNELKKNLGELYFRFITWKIREDINSRNIAFKEAKSFIRVEEEKVFLLFTRIAIRLYSISLELKENILIILDSFIHDEVSKVFKANNDALYNIKLLIKQSSLLAVGIKPEKSDKIENLTFTHQSFMEYLVAYDLADCVFNHSNHRLSNCNATWSIYQRHEISAHFQTEVERRRILLNKPAKKFSTDLHLKNAFENILSETTDFSTYDERVEEVLYYTGKFKIKSNLIKDKLEQIISEKIESVNEYKRTAHLSLTLITANPIFTEAFVRKLIDSYNNDKRLYCISREIDMRYYGPKSIRAKLYDHVKNYKRYGSLNKLNAYRIFIYFTSEDIESISDYKKLIGEIKQVKNYALRFYEKNLRRAKLHKGIALICDEIKIILKKENPLYHV